MRRILKHAFFFLMIVLSMHYWRPAEAADTGQTPTVFNWKKAYFFNFYDVCPLSSGDVWLVGSKGMICAYLKEQNQWVIQESNFHRNLYGVSFPTAEKGWICGQDGTILSTDNKGKTWSRQQVDTTEHLFSICFTDENRGWAVGTYGTILHTTNGGKFWRPQGEQVDRIHNAVFFADALHGWVVGEFGTIIHTEDGGETWQTQETPLGEKTLFSIFFEDNVTGFASGMDGSIIGTKDGGKTWTVIDSSVPENLFAVTARGDRQWAVGLKGTYVKKTNGQWINASTALPTRAWLKKCAFMDDKTGWIVGSVGTVLRTTDGGETWVPAGNGFSK